MLQKWIECFVLFKYSVTESKTAVDTRRWGSNTENEITSAETKIYSECLRWLLLQYVMTFGDRCVLYCISITGTRGMLIESLHDLQSEIRLEQKKTNSTTHCFIYILPKARRAWWSMFHNNFQEIEKKISQVKSDWVTPPRVY